MNDYSDLSDGLYADIETSKGNIVLQLYFEQVPTTVSNFVALAEGNHPVVDEQHSGKPYYNGLKFHRSYRKLYDSRWRSNRDRFWWSRISV